MNHIRKQLKSHWENFALDIRLNRLCSGEKNKNSIFFASKNPRLDVDQSLYGI